MCLCSRKQTMMCALSHRMTIRVHPVGIYPQWGGRIRPRDRCPGWWHQCWVMGAATMCFWIWGSVFPHSCSLAHHCVGLTVWRKLSLTNSNSRIDRNTPRAGRMKEKSLPLMLPSILGSPNWEGLIWKEWWNTETDLAYWAATNFFISSPACHKHQQLLSYRQLWGDSLFCALWWEPI